MIDLNVALAYDGIETVDVLERQILDEVRRLLAEASNEIANTNLASLLERSDDTEAAALNSL